MVIKKKEVLGVILENRIKIMEIERPPKNVINEFLEHGLLISCHSSLIHLPAQDTVVNFI